MTRLILSRHADFTSAYHYRINFKDLEINSGGLVSYSFNDGLIITSKNWRHNERTTKTNCKT